MKKIIKIIVLLFFFGSVTAFVFFRSQNKIGINEIKISTFIDSPTLIKESFFPEKPDTSIVNKRIRAENSLTSRLEIRETDSLILQYLVKLDSFHKYMIMMTSKSLVINSESDTQNNEKLLNNENAKEQKEKEIKDIIEYRASIFLDKE